VGHYKDPEPNIDPGGALSSIMSHPRGTKSKLMERASRQEGKVLRYMLCNTTVTSHSVSVDNFRDCA
jgi:hypothetical protein